MKRIAILTAALATLVVAAPAAAHIPRLAEYVKAAESAFPHTLCDVRYVQGGGEMRWPDRYVEFTGAEGGCLVRFNVRFTREIHRMHPASLCRLVTHERGHAAGRAHSPNPNSVMHGHRLWPPVSPCKKFRRAPQRLRWR